jgi:hypothetical protein
MGKQKEHEELRRLRKRRLEESKSADRLRIRAADFCSERSSKVPDGRR